MNINFERLKKKIISKNFTVGIIGLGYVGLPIANRFIKKNIKVIGLEQDKNKIEKLKKGISYINSPSLKKFRYFKNFKKNISNDYKILKNCDVILVCLPTPLKNKTPDMSYVYKCGSKIKKVVKHSQLIILESTVFPGATFEFYKKFKQRQFLIGKNIFLGYSPERENPGDKKFSYKSTPKVVSGYTNKCANLTDCVYKHIVKKTVKAKNLKSAETSKLLENLYRSVNIGLINELKIICNNLKIDVFEVIKLAATKNFGFQKFMPGPGLGGHCIPIDPFYLSWISKKNGYDPIILKASGSINNNMPNYIIKKILKFSPKKILLVGLSFKKNVDDDRESTTYVFMKLLDKYKIRYNFFDPYIKATKLGRQNNKNLKSVKLTKQEIKKYDMCIILTDHDNINYSLIAKEAKLIIDTRGIFKKLKLGSKKIINL